MTRTLLDEVTNRLTTVYQPKAIYLFGSQAWGRPDQQSDLDVLIVVNSSDEKPYIRPRKGLASLNGLKIAKDLIVYTTEEFEALASDVSSLCHKIKIEGVKLYEAA
jgi:uncharacterized protein